MTESDKALANAAKERGNVLFAKKTRESYEQALNEYADGLKHDPENHVLYANSAACHIEIAADEWEPKRKVESYARASIAAQRCIQISPAWAKGYARLSTAEFELVAARAKLEERKREDEKWSKEDIGGDRTGNSSFPRKDYTLEASLVDTVEGASYAHCEAICRKGLEFEPANDIFRMRLQSLRDAGYTTDEQKDHELRQPEAAAPLKAQGNTKFSSKRWKEAAELYTKALAQDPFDHVFYSNRSACYAENQEYEKALADAERCVALNDKFAKGYSRLALALYHMGRYPEMELAAKKGVELDPSSMALQDLLKSALVETKESPEVQQYLHQLRKEKAQEQKLQDLLKGINGGAGPCIFDGNNPNLFDPLSRFGFGSGSGFGGLGSGKARMTEEQMRGMARAMASKPTDTTGGSRGGGYSVASVPVAPSSVPAASGPVACAPP